MAIGIAEVVQLHIDLLERAVRAEAELAKAKAELKQLKEKANANTS